MDPIAQAIEAVKDHCGKCQYGVALQALEALGRGEVMEVPTVLPEEKPKGNREAKSIPWSNLDHSSCTKCGLAKTNGEFRDGHKVCRDCERKYAREWYHKKAGANPPAPAAPVAAGRLG